MADKLPYFSEGDAGRISDSVNFTETMNREGSQFYNYDPMNNPDIIYVKLTSKDAGGAGMWLATEHRYETNKWVEVTDGRVFDGTTYPYIRHHSWEDAEQGQIVKARLIINVVSGSEEWVFTTDVTNPEGLIFYADDSGGTGQARNNSLWTTKVGAQVLTNVGTFDIPEGFQIGVGQKAQVLITFVDEGNGYVLTSAAMQLGSGRYWTEAAGVIIVRWPIAEVTAVGDLGRLKQYHSGDIHLEIFTFATDEDEDREEDDAYSQVMEVCGDGKWIDVTRAGRKFTVSHRLPNPELVWKTLELLKNGGGFHTVKIDQMGHVVSVDDEVPPGQDDFVTVTSTLTSALVGSDIRPEAVGGEGIDIDYKLFSNGNNFLDWIAVQKHMLTVKNDIAEPLVFSRAAIADAGMTPFDSELLENNANTAGANIPALFFGVQNFRFNATIKAKINVVFKGVPQSVTHSTATCTPTNTVSSTIIRDVEDPNNSPFTVTVSYSLTNLDDAYETKLEFTLADGTPVPYQIEGELEIQGGRGATVLTLDATSATAEQQIYFDFESMGDNKPSPGDVITMKSTLQSTANGYDANASKTTFLNYMTESDCVTDESGQDISDGTNDCISSATIYELPSAGCSYPGVALFTLSTQEKVNVTNTSWASAKATIDDPDASVTVAAGVAEIDRDPPVFGVGRQYVTIDTTGSALAQVRVNYSETVGNSNDRIYVMHYEGAITDTNPVGNMLNWTPLGYIDCTTNGNYDVDISGLIPSGTNQNIGVMVQDDYDNTLVSALNTKTSFYITHVYRCV